LSATGNRGGTIYAIEVRHTSYVTGETKTKVNRVRYKSLARAELAAQRLRCVVIPSDGIRVSETWARVFEVDK
jgi:hypothetical protein